MAGKLYWLSRKALAFITCFVRKAGFYRGDLLWLETWQSCGAVTWCGSWSRRNRYFYALLPYLSIMALVYQSTGFAGTDAGVIAVIFGSLLACSDL